MISKISPFKIFVIQRKFCLESNIKQQMHIGKEKRLKISTLNILFKKLEKTSKLNPKKEKKGNNESKTMPWLVWLGGLSAGLRIERSPVRFPVRTHAWVAGQVPCWVCARGNHTLMCLFLSFSFPSKNK